MIIRTQEDVTAAVLSEIERAPDPRFREVMSAFVRHLHAFAREVRLTEAEFQTAIANRGGTKPSVLRLYWGWHSSNGWSAPGNARWAFAAEPMLSKLYIVRETGGIAVDPKADPCAQFLTLLLPELDRVMSPSSQPTGAKSSGILK